ncbi:MAG: DUF4276 family protein [Candidatus Competibacteraceae bacterium]|nr:DUF4276 family protein [Candidatus Competibacteraceae bacterium]
MKAVENAEVLGVEHIEVLVEEPSMETALRLLLPKILGATTFNVYVHQCKNDLLARLPERLRGYAKWIPSNWCIVVVIDRDDDDCTALKANLEKTAIETNFTTRSRAENRAYNLVNRLAIEELEAWYFGDWAAVRAAYPRVMATIPSQQKYRDPDAISGGTWEAFERILRKGGYFKGGLRKIEAAQTIAAYMDPTRNTSKSFQVLRAALLEMVIKR